jgi:hypothetical protein
VYTSAAIVVTRIVRFNRAAVGKNEVDAVGNIVGTTIGFGDLIALGVEVGTTDGFTVFIAVEKKLGVEVGTTVGARVGFGNGKTDIVKSPSQTLFIKQPSTNSNLSQDLVEGWIETLNPEQYQQKSSLYAI